MKQELPSSDFRYTGAENLEVMSEARRYNCFLVDQVLKHAPATGTVVDFGAGVGTFATAIRERGREVCCVEPDPEQRSAIANLGLVGLSSLEQIESRVAYVYSLNVLEHIQDDEAVLGQIASKLMAGGSLFLYVPAFPLLFGPMDKLVGHVRRYKQRELARKVAACGLDVVRCEYVDSLGFAASLVFNALGGGNGGRLDPRAVRLYDRFAFPVSRALDKICSSVLGKNVLLVARKP